MAGEPLRNMVIYRPKPGGEAAMLALILKHEPALRGTGLVTDAPFEVYRSVDIRADNAVTFVETFTWRDAEAAGIAHQTPEIMAVWEPMTALLDDLRILEQLAPVEAGD